MNHIIREHIREHYPRLKAELISRAGRCTTQENPEYIRGVIEAITGPRPYHELLMKGVPLIGRAR